MIVTLNIETVSGVIFTDEIHMVIYLDQSAMENMVDAFNDWYPYWSPFNTTEPLKSVEFVSSTTGKLYGKLMPQKK